MGNRLPNVLTGFRINLNTCNFFNDLCLILNNNFSIFDNIILLGDFNIDLINKKNSNLNNF